MNIATLLEQLQALLRQFTNDPSASQEIRRIVSSMELALDSRVAITQNIGHVEANAQVVGLQAIIKDPRIDPEIKEKLEVIERQLARLIRPRAFVSSTWRDLGPYCRDLRRRLRDSGLYEVLSRETIKTGTVHPIELCKQQVERSELFIGLYGPRYGSVAPGSDLSYTERELAHAREHFCRCLCFIAAPDAPGLVLKPVPKPEPPEEEQAKPFTAFYVEPDDFDKLVDAVLGWLGIKGRPRLPAQEAQARSKYEAYTASVRLRNIQARAEYQKQRQEHLDYLFQSSRQASFRELVNRDLCPVQFESLPDLREKFDRALTQFTAGERTGLVPVDIARRWRTKATAEQMALSHHLLDSQPLLPSSIELQPLSSDAASSDATLWQTFLDYEWHTEVQQLAGEIHAASLAASRLPHLGDEVHPPGPLPATVFSVRYDDIAENLKPWYRDHLAAHAHAKSMRDALVADARHAVGIWQEDSDDLHDFLLKPPRSHYAVKWLDHAARKAEEVYQAWTSASKTTLLAPAIAPPEGLSALLTDPADVDACAVDLWEWHAQADLCLEQSKTEISAFNSRSNEVLGRWHNLTGELQQRARQPRFGRVLFLMSRAGSGKTHALARILQECDKTGVCPVVLQRANSHLNWGAQILKAAELQPGVGGPIAGPRWRNLEELDGYIGGRTAEQFGPARLVIVLEDAGTWLQEAAAHGRPALFKDLLDFIAAHTHLHSLYWVITVPEADYNRVVQYRQSCQEYGLPRSAEEQALPGWLSLDRLNEDVEIWPAIFQKSGIADKEIAITRQHAIHSARRLLNVPFTAWIAAMLIGQGRTPAECLTLNYIDFVGELWSYRRRELAEGLTETGDGVSLEPQLQRCIKFLAAQFAESGQEQYGQKELLDRLAELDMGENRLADSKVARRIIAGLVRRRLLAITSYDADQVADVGERWQLDTLPFWQYEGGKHLAKLLVGRSFEPGQARLLAGQWFGWEPGSDTRLGLWEFTLLCLDQITGSNRPTDTDTWDTGWARLAATEWQMARSRLWLMAANASPAFQAQLGAVIDELQIRPEGLPIHEPEDLFRFMYFLKHARLLDDGSGLTPHMRLRLLQPYYSEIASYGLRDYFESLVEDLLPEWIAPEEAARSVAYLYGAERLWNAEDWTKRLYARLRRAATDPDELISWLLNDLSREIDHLLYNRAGLIDKLRQRDNLLHDYERCWGMLAGCLCQDLIRTEGVQCLDRLAAAGWFRWPTESSPLHSQVRNLLEEQVTTELGKWYRGAEPTSDLGYIDRIEAMVSSDCGAERATAGYLIYHSVPNTWLDQRLDRRLWEALCTLSHDHDPQVAAMWQRVGERLYDAQRKHFTTSAD